MQVEGLADLLAAETESQRRQALLHSTGALCLTQLLLRQYDALAAASR